jgi:hypothetical protein
MLYKAKKYTTINLTIQPEEGYAPVVIAKGGTDSAGIGAGESMHFLGFIKILGGFVVAQGDAGSISDIGYGSNGQPNSTPVIISGGSVYAVNAALYYQQNDDGTAVYPLYVQASHAGKVVNVAGADYATISADAAAMLAGSHAFFGSAPAGLFPLADLSATFWLPENSSYSGITVDSAGNYSANVTAAIMGYTPGMATNRLVE